LVSGSIEIVFIENRYRKFIHMYTDPIADYLTRVRNAVKANHKVVEIPASKLKKEITKILFDQGYILSYKFDDSGVQGYQNCFKYDKDTKEPVIRDIQRISKPGLRKYAGSSNLPRILNGLGIAIVSTSKGVMTGKQAKQLNVGGEVICYVY
jgi:small subunit ribosomal protein S8